MKIKNFLVALIALLILTFSFGNFSISLNDVQAAESSVSSIEDEDDYTYERVYHDGQWWIYVYDGNDLVAVYPDE